MNSEFICLPCPYRTVFTRDPLGVPYFFVLFSRFLKMVPFYRLNGNFSFKLEQCRAKHWPFFFIKSIFIYEKALKTGIYTVRFTPTIFFLELICFKLVAERFALLKLISLLNVKIQFIFKYGTVRAFDFFNRWILGQKIA